MVTNAYITLTYPQIQMETQLSDNELTQNNRIQCMICAMSIVFNHGRLYSVPVTEFAFSVSWL